MAAPDRRTDVLVVGAGPTGLATAAQVAAHGASVAVVDMARSRVHESRALGVQPRTLEVLHGLGLADELVARGNPAVRLHLHFGSRTVRTKLFDTGLDDTAYPFLLFVSQAETEAVLGEYLTAHGVNVERGVTVLAVAESPDGCRVTTQDRTGARSEVSARYVVGCDGAHSTVRSEARIAFEGGGYPQTFVLADLDVDGLEPGAVHTYLTDTGPFFFFPLDRPAPWRIIGMRTPSLSGDLGLTELQSLADDATGSSVTLRRPVWATPFRVHHRHAATYRSGRMFLAGDAAHIHSPAGAQGMNTGIQDGFNLGWKLAMVCRGRAYESLLDSYDAERRPVGAMVVRFTDRAFGAATSARPVVRFVRRYVAPGVAPYIFRLRPGRASLFRTVSQLGIRYRSSPAVDRTARRPVGRGAVPGDRLPDVRVREDGVQRRLHDVVRGPGFHLVLIGSAAELDVRGLAGRYTSDLSVHRISPVTRRSDAHRRLGVRDSAVFVVRPDGHIGHRADGAYVDGAAGYLGRLLG